MALAGALRCLASVPKAQAAAVLPQVFSAGFATGPALTKKDAAYLLDARDVDVEVDAALSDYCKAAFAGGKEPASAGDVTPLASMVEKKYVAAQVVASGVQNIAVPLGYDAKDLSPVKRYVAQLYKLGNKAGFENPCVEVEKRLAEKARTADTVKDFLGRIEPLCSAEFHASLSEALAAVEAETNSSVTMDSSSEGYKKFAKKVEAVATAAGIPVKTLVDAKKAPTDDVKKSFQAWAQSAAVADAKAELEVLKAEAATLLDKHLTKTADQVQKEAAASLAALQRKLEASKGAPWAAQFQADLKNVAWFDAQVSAAPAVGPKASA